MASSGWTTTSALSDSLPLVIASARIVREVEGVVPQLVDRQKLGEGIGNDWNEITLAQLTAQAVTETTQLDNPQQVSDTKFTVTPSMVGIHTVLTDKLKRRITAKVYARIGELAQNAIQRKKDEDGIVVFDGGTSLAGAATTLTSGHISAAVARISGNTTEQGKPPFRAVLHDWQIKDLQDELLSGIGTYPVPEGETARVYRDGFRGRIAGAEIYADGNITIDSSDDAKGGVFSREGIVLVEGKAPWVEPKREPGLGGGSDSLYHYDEYSFAERLAAGTTSSWLFEVYSDCTAPTS